MYNTETEIYSLATCPGTKYSGDTITLRATPRDGIGPYYVAFKKDGIIIDPSRLGGESNPILNAPENVEITRTYTLDDVDVRNALTGTIDFSVFIRGSCPTGGGLQFDGVNDYVDAGNGASLNITGAITVSAWIKFNGFPLSGQTTFIYKGIPTGGLYDTYGYGVFYSQSNNRLYLLASGLSDEYIEGTKSSWNVGQYYHIVVIYTGSDVSHYVDGILDRTQSVTGNINPTSGNLYFGYKENSQSKYFNGTLDEVHIYNRALSPTEILGLYNGSTPRNGLVLEHIYSMGNANDLSGYGNNGIPINGPVFIPNACMDTCTVAIGCIAPVCNFVVT